MSLFIRQLVRRLHRGLGKDPEARRPFRRRSRLGLEALNDRVVPATIDVNAAGALIYTANVDLADNLTITYSNGNYTFSDPGGQIDIVNGIDLSFTGNGTNSLTLINEPITSISVVLDNLDNDKADTLVLRSSGVAVAVDTGNGADTVSLGGSGPNSTLSNIQGMVTVNGGSDLFPGDKLILNDSGGGAGRVYTIRSDAVLLNGSNFVRFNGLENLEANTSNSGATVNVQGTPAGTKLLVTGGSRDDRFNVGTGGSASTLTGFGETFTLNGGGGANRLTFNDQGTTVDTTYDILATTLFRTGTPQIGYSGMSSLRFNAGSGADSVNIMGAPAGTTVEIHGGAGNDAFAIGNVNDSLDDIAGPVKVYGEANSGGKDTLTLNDLGDGNSQSYTVTSNSVTRGAALINYETVERLTVNGTAQDDDFLVVSSAAGTPVTLNARGGGDFIDVGSVPFWSTGGATSTLAGISGSLTVNGGGNPAGEEDTLYVNDQGTTTAQIFNVSSTEVSRGTVRIGYNGLELLNAFAGGGDDMCNVASTFAGASTGVFMGPGADTCDVGEPGSGTLANIDGELYVHGDDLSGNASPGDVMKFHDQNGSFLLPGLGGQTYTFDVDSVGRSSMDRSGAAPISYDRLEDVTLHGTHRADTVNLVATSAAIPLTVNGGDGSDRYVVGGGTGSTANLLGTVNVDGERDKDWLDYSAFTAGVEVNLLAGTATGLSAFSGIENVEGGEGSDWIVGDTNVNELRGNGGLDLLIGGLAADMLDGGADDDMLIAGTTDYDQQASDLDAILAAWSGVGIYQARLNAVAALGVNSTTVHDDGAIDTLTGAAGRDWFVDQAVPTGDVLDNAGNESLI